MGVGGQHGGGGQYGGGGTRGEGGQGGGDKGEGTIWGHLVQSACTTGCLPQRDFAQQEQTEKKLAHSSFVECTVKFTKNSLCDH